MITGRVLALTAAEPVDQPIAAEEDQTAGETPAAIDPWPDDLAAASSIRSKDTALISTPAPKPMISPIVRRLRWNRSATSAPITSRTLPPCPTS